MLIWINNHLLHKDGIKEKDHLYLQYKIIIYMVEAQQMMDMLLFL